MPTRDDPYTQCHVAPTFAVQSSSAESGCRWIGVGLPAALLFAGSIVPLPPRQDPTFGPYGPDKLLHLLGHAWLAAALVTALDGDGERTPRATLLTVALSTGYGVLTERLQEAVPGREFERADVLAGLLGSLLGVAVRHRRLARS